MNIKRIVRKTILFSCLFGLAGFGAYTGVVTGSNKISELYEGVYYDISRKFARTEIIKVPMEPEAKTLVDIIKGAAKKHRLPTMLIAALITQESGSGFRTDRLRFEPDVYTRVKAKAYQTDAEAKMQATSIGLGQIIPYFHAGKRPECPQEWSKYLDPETNLNCSGAILRECLDRQSGGKYESIRVCLSKYNGDRTGVYASEVLGRIAQLTIEGMTL